jgi:hypothetical protein
MNPQHDYLGLTYASLGFSALFITQGFSSIKLYSEFSGYMLQQTALIIGNHHEKSPDLQKS